ncbi:hypothetical protein ECTOBSL9_1686 [Ectothiorhodospira sp. BSL-9]|nr:hypothetical protein ECTOBSL9_1686 [Ectothiorhodospira sp. BSL-9]
MPAAFAGKARSHREMGLTEGSDPLRDRAQREHGAHWGLGGLWGLLWELACRRCAATAAPCLRFVPAAFAGKARSHREQLTQEWPGI